MRVLLGVAALGLLLFVAWVVVFQFIYTGN